MKPKEQALEHAQVILDTFIGTGRYVEEYIRTLKVGTMEFTALRDQIDLELAAEENPEGPNAQFLLGKIVRRSQLSHYLTASQRSKRLIDQLSSSIEKVMALSPLQNFSTDIKPVLARSTALGLINDWVKNLRQPA